MQEGQNTRQQVIERIRQSTSILVAVGENPSVDALAAALGLALMLNKMNKHTTAVFSGQIPPAIQFLEPAKTFESSVDALRDFIISLDKEKADRLRYKVEDDVVRIFITPYKTTITEKDLQYSQGDFNVDLIIALGVEKRDDLDKAIVSHGRILHDATVITVNANAQHSSLGSLDWNDTAASSLCEMLVSASEGFQQPGLLDAQISTALLTGIVAATDRFSNPNTSPRVMTMAAQLMAAGANQQLIATNLAKPAAPQAQGPVAKQPGSTTAQPLAEEKPKAKDGEIDITHPKEESKPTQSAEDELAASLPTAAAANSAFADLKSQLENETSRQEVVDEETPKAPGGESVNAIAAAPPAQDEDYISSHGSWKGKRLEPPTLGGTLNATAEEAFEDAQKAEDDNRNKKLLTHPGDQSADAATEQTNAPLPPMPSMLQTPEPPEVAPPAADAPQPVTPPPLEAAAAPLPVPEPDIDALHKAAVDSATQTAEAPVAEATGAVNSARQEVHEALNAPVPAMPADVPIAEPLSADALQALPPAPVAPAPSSAPAPAMSPSDLPPMPPMPPLPTSETALPPAPDLPGLSEPLPPMGSDTPLPPQAPPAAPSAGAPPSDPGQFRIPGS